MRVSNSWSVCETRQKMAWCPEGNGKDWERGATNGSDPRERGPLVKAGGEGALSQRDSGAEEGH